MPLSEMYRTMLEANNPATWEKNRQSELMGQMLLQEKQQQLDEASRLRELFSRGGMPSEEAMFAASPATAMKYRESQNKQMKDFIEMQKAQQDIASSQFKLNAEQETLLGQAHGAVVDAFDQLIAQGIPKDKAIQIVTPYAGQLTSHLATLGVRTGQSFDPKNINEDSIENMRLSARRSKYPLMADKTLQEAQLRNLPPAESSEHYWGTSERVDRNPITHGPEILPGTSGRRGKLGKQAPMEDFTDYNIADEQGNLVSFSPENLPKLKDLYQKIENPSVKSKLGIYISQVQQGGQLPTAKGITPEEKAAFAKEEAKGRKVGEAEATREIQHEKMTSAFDEQHLKDLINKSTPGGVAEYGTMATKAATLSTPWSKADTQLGIDAAALLQSVPRFEGPQSDADRASYEKAAGNLANPSIPRGDRIAAVNEMKRLLDKYEIKYGKESNLDEAVKGRRKAALDMLDKGEIDEAQFKTMWDQK